MRAFDKIIVCVIAVLAASIGPLSARHSTPTPPSAPVTVKYEPHERIQFDRRIEHLSIQNATFDQLINEISKAANITIICQPTDYAAKVPRATVKWTNMRLDTAVWIAFTVFEQDPRLLFVDEKARLVEGRAGYAVPASPRVLYDLRSIHMTEGDTDATEVIDHTIQGAWEDRISTYSMPWRVLQNMVDGQIPSYRNYYADVARPFLVSDKSVGCAVPTRDLIHALTHPRSPRAGTEPFAFNGAGRIKEIRLTNVSVGEALQRACEASHVNTVFAFEPDNEPADFISVELRDVTLSQAISQIFDSAPIPSVGASIREVDGVAVVCDQMVSIGRYPVVYDVRKIIQNPKSWYDPSDARSIFNDEFVDKQDPCLMPGVALASLLAEEASLNGQLSGAHYWRGRIIVKAPIRSHRAIEKMLAHILATGRVEDESQ